MSPTIVDAIKKLSLRPDGCWDAELVHMSTGDQVVAVLKPMDLVRFRSFRNAVAKKGGPRFEPAESYSGEGSGTRWDEMIKSRIAKAG